MRHFEAHWKDWAQAMRLATRTVSFALRARS